MHVVSPVQWVVVISVLGGMITLYLAAAFLVIRPLISPKDRVPPLGSTGIMILSGTILSFLCIAYATYIEPYQLEVTHVRLPIPGLPGPVRMVQISDLHCDAKVRLEDKLPSVIAEQKPDLIAYTGDSVNSFAGEETFQECLSKITRIAPTFGVQGDWDTAFPNRDRFKRAGIREPHNSVVEVRRSKLCIMCDEPAPLQDAPVPRGIPCVFLHHYPDHPMIVNGTVKGIALYCCGHTHGGQIALPFYGAFVTQSVQGKKYESGLHRLNQTWIYTNRGIGMEGHFPRMRFFARPEVTVFDLVPAHSSQSFSSQ